VSEQEQQREGGRARGGEGGQGDRSMSAGSAGLGGIDRVRSEAPEDARVDACSSRDLSRRIGSAAAPRQ
jgi:hypothetical protein